MERYLGIDVHAAGSAICVLDAAGQKVEETTVATRHDALVGYLRRQKGRLHVCIEETEWSEWLTEILSPHVAKLVSVPGKWEPGCKSDRIDAGRLAERLRTGQIKRVVYHNPHKYALLRELARSYRKLTGDVARSKNRLSSMFRRRGVACRKEDIYDWDARQELLDRLPPSMRPSVESQGMVLACLEHLKDEMEAKLIAESHRHPISRTLETAPGLGKIRVAQMIPIVVTPHRFPTKRHFWSYCGFGVVTRTSGDHVQSPNGEWVWGSVTRTRGLNSHNNQPLKSIFKGAATTVTVHMKQHPLRDVYQRLLDNGTKPNLAKLTIARKIAALTLAMWKSKETYDPEKTTAYL